MSDAPILGPLNLVADLDAAGDFERKHTPYIGIERDGDAIHVTLEVGHHVNHPNLPDHYIQWIELLAGDAPIARFDLSPVATDPNVRVTIHVDEGTTLRAVEYCNLHGLWAAEVTV